MPSCEQTLVGLCSHFAATRHWLTHGGFFFGFDATMTHEDARSTERVWGAFGATQGRVCRKTRKMGI